MKTKVSTRLDQRGKPKKSGGKRSKSLVQLQAAKEKIKNAHETLALVLEGMSDAFFVVDSEWRFTEMNRNAELLLHRTRQELIGKNVWEEFPPAVDSQFYSKYHEALNTCETVQFEEYYDPLSAWLEVIAHPLKKQDHAPVIVDEKPHCMGLFVFFRNITARKEAQLVRENLLNEQAEIALGQRHFLKEVLFSVTEGRLRLCDKPDELPILPTPSFYRTVAVSTSADLSRVRKAVQEAGEHCQFATERIYDLMSAVSEAAMNALQHCDCVTTPAEVSVATAEDYSEIQVRITDKGKGIEWSDLPRATLLRGHSSGATLGHGFYLILHSADQVHLLTGPSGTSVFLRQFPQPLDLDWFTKLPK